MARKRKTGGGFMVHAHGCTNCRDRYEDACNSPDTNALCLNCRAGWLARNPLFIFARLPHVCCFEKTRLARKDEIEKYSLSRACMWFICETCKRTFPFANPRHLPADEQRPACCFYAVQPVDEIKRRRLHLAPEVLTVCVLCGTPQEESHAH